MDYTGVVLQNRNNKFLLQLRDNKKNIPNSNKWVIFGGGLKSKERPLEGIIREIKEELDLSLNKKDLDLVIKIPFLRKKYHIYKARLKVNSSSLKLNEGSKMKLFSKEEIIKTKNVYLPIKLFFILFKFISPSPYKHGGNLRYPSLVNPIPQNTLFS